MPIFTTLKTNLHPELYRRSFVVYIDSQDNVTFADAFAGFMNQVRNPDAVRPLIEEFVHEFLQPGEVYRRLCIEFGICGKARTSTKTHILQNEI